ncbi:Tigger transposable element-derived protein 6-like [Oopsacas minuta]|uniref:Tigger transposable element-derived protein 6-like n=1 Tax=Oopsacas minuta TaxID=111878 RepID=A0AAV7JG62_9METZ|nr:Tigger transposable element-derived protein 6-like [Oopsacas minuta]
MYEDIETAVIEFLKLARDRRMAVTGPMLSTLAEREASANGVEGFKASEGWLSRVKGRHGICGRALSGDAADETGLYFRATSTKSLVLPKDTAHGIIQDKSRLTLMVCTSMLGEKEKLLLIWKSEKPWALKGADMSKLPVVYKAQRKAWMIGLVFCCWMKDSTTECSN